MGETSLNPGKPQSRAYLTTAHTGLLPYPGVRMPLDRIMINILIGLIF